MTHIFGWFSSSPWISVRVRIFDRGKTFLIPKSLAFFLLLGKKSLCQEFELSRPGLRTKTPTSPFKMSVIWNDWSSHKMQREWQDGDLWTIFSSMHTLSYPWKCVSIWRCLSQQALRENGHISGFPRSHSASQRCLKIDGNAFKTLFAYTDRVTTCLSQLRMGCRILLVPFLFQSVHFVCGKTTADSVQCLVNRRTDNSRKWKLGPIYFHWICTARNGRKELCHTSIFLKPNYR